MDAGRVKSIVTQTTQDEPDGEVVDLLTQMADDVLVALIQTAATKAEQRGSQELELCDLESVASEWKLDRL